jgi:hypothetical protein
MCNRAPTLGIVPQPLTNAIMKMSNGNTLTFFGKFDS